MIDAEKLLGKVLSGAMQSTGKKKNRKRKKSDNFLGSLVGGLTSGKGLMTAIGLGVGAYEIYKQQSNGSHPQSGVGNLPPQSIPPVPSQSQTSATPPPIPGGAVVTPPMPTIPQEIGGEAGGNEQDLAITLIQTMVAAAHADGELDSEEESRILEKLQEQGLDKEEKQYILMQLHSPKPIADLTYGVDNPMVAHTMYSLAASTIVVDTEQERQWLNHLAKELAISTAMQKFIEEEL